jgi:hypothetical protein
MEGDERTAKAAIYGLNRASGRKLEVRHQKHIERLKVFATHRGKCLSRVSCVWILACIVELAPSYDADERW